jgi:hypothetical protein
MDAGSVTNLAAAGKEQATQDKQEEKDTRRQFNYALVKVGWIDGSFVTWQTK